MSRGFSQTYKIGNNGTTVNYVFPGADLGFPVGGGADTRGGGANIRFCQNFPKTA